MQGCRDVGMGEAASMRTVEVAPESTFKQSWLQVIPVEIIDGVSLRLSKSHGEAQLIGLHEVTHTPHKTACDA